MNTNDRPSREGQYFENKRNLNPINTDREETDNNETDFASPDKYLAMEQTGVTFTQDPAHVANTDSTTPETGGQSSDLWDPETVVSRNSDAFNQDEYILRDNLDLDEDQSQSISSDDDFDTNTLDETR